ncbi:MAG: alpha/beta hydrolase family protein [Candidatus Binatia bacterium]
MSGIGRYENPFRNVEYCGELPTGSAVVIHLVETEDLAACHGFLYLPPGRRPRTVVTFMHPRADFTRHYAVPGLLERGYAVWTQNSRSVGNDSMLIHERVLLDVAAAVRRLRDSGFERVVLCGNSGGGSLYGFYLSQAHAAPGGRLTDTPGGDPLDLNRFTMPRADGFACLAAHPGEGHFLLRAIDPSVTDEDDLLSCDPSLDLFDPANGFRRPPATSEYGEEFLARYRAAQRARVERIDHLAREMIARRTAARRRAAAAPDDLRSRREAISVPMMTVYRTNADPRYVDLRLDPSARDYGDLFSRRPDLFNWGPVGFARVVSPDAWLSTWSGLSSRAEIERTGPSVDVPAIVIAYTGDNAIMPSDHRLVFESLGTRDKRFLEVPGDHYGFALPGESRAGRDIAVGQLADWLDERC